MMASLRARLLAGVLGLSAAGLLLLGGITYGEQRSFLLQRMDGQVRGATHAVAASLARRGLPADQDGDLRRLPPDGGPQRGPFGAPPDHGGPFGPPAGTYGQLRDRSGRVLGSAVLPGTGTVSARPALPARLPLGRFVTVDGRAGAGTRYRVRALPTAAGGVLVVAVPMRDVDQTLERLLLVEGLVIAGVLAVLGVVAWLVVRIGLRPLDRIGLTARAIAGGDLSHRVGSTDPRTEVGRLGVAFNAMLDRLEAAFAQRRASEQRLRQFLADASHELRTPLASIRGYAELHRMGAMSGDAETERAMRRIEQESTRMGDLVDDLLTLARLGEVPTAPRVEVDLAALARDAAEDARATAPDRRIDCRRDGRTQVMGDPHGLRQVLANLLRNALVHTPAGTAIDISVAGAAQEVRLEVRDHGQGLPDVDPGSLFERFWRAEGGRERGRGGAGLGLAIVAGIVAAHGGRVEAANARGGGAAFTVHLPVAGNGRAPGA